MQTDHEGCRAGPAADDAGPLPQLLFLARVIGAYGRITYQAGDQVDSAYVRVPGEGTGKIDDVLGLPPGIGVPAQFQVVTANETVNAEQADRYATAVVIRDRDS